MNSTADYLDRFARITADVVECTVESRNDDDTYMVLTIGSRALIRAAKANPVDEFALHSRVMVSNPSSSRTVIGAHAVILTRAPRDQRGLSATTPAETRRSVSRPFVTAWHPDPLVLTAGGEPGEQTFIGGGFEDAPEYEARGMDDDPALTDEDDPAITDRRIVVTISADAGSPVGDFDAVVAGIRCRGALKIQPAEEEPPPEPGLLPALYVFGGESWLRVFDPVSLELIVRHTDYVFGATVLPGWIGLAGTTLLAVVRGDGGPDVKVVAIDSMTGERGTDFHIPLAGGDSGEVGYSCASVGDELWIPAPAHTVGDGCDVMRISADGTLAYYNEAGDFGFAPSIITDGVSVWMYGTDTLARIWPDSASVASLGVFWFGQMAVTADALWLLDSGTGSGAQRLRKVAKDTLAESFSAAKGPFAIAHLCAVGDLLFMVAQLGADAGSSAAVYLVNQDTGATNIVATATGTLGTPGFTPFAVTAGDGALYVTDAYNGRVARIETETFTISYSDFDPDGIAYVFAFATPPGGNGTFSF